MYKPGMIQGSQGTTGNIVPWHHLCSMLRLGNKPQRPVRTRWKFMRYLSTTICLLLSLILVGIAGAAETSAPTDQNSAAEAARNSGSKERLPAQCLARFDVACSAKGPRAASLNFELAEPQYVTLGIYDESGQLVRGLLEGESPAGFQSVSWNGRDRTGKDLVSGQYYALLGVAGRYAVRALPLERQESR